MYLFGRCYNKFPLHSHGTGVGKNQPLLISPYLTDDNEAQLQHGFVAILSLYDGLSLSFS